MNNFYLLARRKLSLVNNLYKDFGAHLCLYVTGKKKTDVHVVQRCARILIHDVNSIKIVPIVGYVQMDEQLYLRWLPAIFQSIWLNEFRKNQHLVLT